MCATAVMAVHDAIRVAGGFRSSCSAATRRPLIEGNTVVKKRAPKRRNKKGRMREMKEREKERGR